MCKKSAGSSDSWVHSDKVLARCSVFVAVTLNAGFEGQFYLINIQSVVWGGKKSGETCKGGKINQ